MNNKLISIIVAITAGIIAIGAVLVPVVNDALVTVGDSVEYFNNTGQAYKPAVPGDVLEGSRSNVDDVNIDTWTLNNEPITGFSSSGAAWTSLIFSDGMYGKILNGNNASMAEIYDMSTNNLVPKYVTYVKLTFSSETIEVKATINGTTNTYNWPYTWAYIPCDSNDGVLIANAGPTNAYVSKDSFVVLAGFYSTGDIDRFYYSNNNPDLTILGEGSGSYTKTYNLIEGTTDVYRLGISVSVTDGTDVEEFAPYQILVPYKVVGHSDTGATYSLLSAIPVVVILALLVAVIGVLIRPRY